MTCWHCPHGRGAIPLHSQPQRPLLTSPPLFSHDDCQPLVHALQTAMPTTNTSSPWLQEPVPDMAVVAERTVYRRYSEFERFRGDLAREGVLLPGLFPPKSTLLTLL